jgi:hypothetical protein
MRKKTINVARTAASWIQLFLGVRLPIAIGIGLRSRERRS